MSKGKGKGKFHGSPDFDNMVARARDCLSRPCSCGGCEFAVTWHPTHCCSGCQASGGQRHGLRCERVLFHPVAVEGTDKDENQEEAATGQSGSNRGPFFDFVFPVVVEDGRHL